MPVRDFLTWKMVLATLDVFGFPYAFLSLSHHFGNECLDISMTTEVLDSSDSASIISN